METPSSMRRVTRSQTKAALSSAKSNDDNPFSRIIEDSEKSETKSRRRNEKEQQDRTALIDITNDSPIVGLAMGKLGTPSSSIMKQRSIRAKRTPGSGEALLRGQVKTLLQKVEEEGEISKLASENRPFIHLKRFLYSPMRLLAPTPVNTPLISDLCGDANKNANGLDSAFPSLVEEELISQVVNDLFEGKNPEGLESQKSVITRSLFSDFSEQSEVSDSSESSSVLTCQEEAVESTNEEKSSLDDDGDDASIWSIQVNASPHDEDDAGDEYFDREDDNPDDADGLIDELCDGIGKISVNEKSLAAEFQGKHIRFAYNSDDEIAEDEEDGSEAGDSSRVSPSVMHLKGLPTPRGKHLRFPLEEEEEK